MSGILDLPGQLLDATVQIFSFLLSIPGLLLDMLINISIMILYPVLDLSYYIISDIGILVSYLIQILQDTATMCGLVVELLANLVNCIGYAAWSTLILTAVLIAIGLKIYNIIADTEVLGNKLPKVGK